MTSRTPAVRRARAVLAGLGLMALGCRPQPAPETVVFVDAIDSLGSILTRDGVAWDSGVSHDGHGAIRIEATQPTTIRLAEVNPANAENVMLTYRAHLRTEGLDGQAYLEMWCGIPGQGEFFSRALQAPVSGTTGWVTQETPFFLEKGQRAQVVKLNVVVAGTGTVWVDEISLVQTGR